MSSIHLWGRWKNVFFNGQDRHQIECDVHKRNNIAQHILHIVRTQQWPSPTAIYQTRSRNMCRRRASLKSDNSLNFWTCFRYCARLSMALKCWFLFGSYRSWIECEYPLIKVRVETLSTRLGFMFCH